MGTLINIDIQPEYAEYVGFDLNDWGQMVNNHEGTLIFLFNGFDSLGMISEDDYRWWLFEHCEVSEETIDRAIFYDKGYAFFRYCIDNSIEDETIVSFIKQMVEFDINDSRELTKDFWQTFVDRNGEDDIRELLEFSDDCISIPDLMDFLKDYNNITICGGGVDQCLKEVEIALMALDIPYETYGEYVYEEKKIDSNLIESVNRIKSIMGFENELELGVKIEESIRPNKTIAKYVAMGRLNEHPEHYSRLMSVGITNQELLLREAKNALNESMYPAKDFSDKTGIIVHQEWNLPFDGEKLNKFLSVNNPHEPEFDEAVDAIWPEFVRIHPRIVSWLTEIKGEETKAKYDIMHGMVSKYNEDDIRSYLKKTGTDYTEGEKWERKQLSIKLDVKIRWMPSSKTFEKMKNGVDHPLNESNMLDAIPGLNVWNHILDLTQHDKDIPTSFESRVISRKFKRVDYDIQELVDGDENLTDFMNDRVRQVNDPEINDQNLDYPVVVIDGELIDGHARVGLRWKNGETTVPSYVAI